MQESVNQQFEGHTQRVQAYNRICRVAMVLVVGLGGNNMD